MNDGFEDRSFGEGEAVQQIQQCLKLLTQELSTGQKIRQDKQDEQDYFIFHHGKS